MNLIFFLLRSSWGMVAIAIFTGFISGSSSAALIALISRAVSQDSSSIKNLFWSFLGLAIIALLTSIISQVGLIRLSQEAVFQLRLRLSRQILSSQLSHLEHLGNPRLLATLAEDVQDVANAVFVLPFLCIDLAIVFGCLFYITWLSWVVSLMVFAFLGVAMGSCQLLLKRGDKLLFLAREEQDLLFIHFRTLTEGIKELKLHYQRRQAFFVEDFQATATKFRRHNVQGLTLFAITASWGKLLFFFAIGFVLFALPKFITINHQTLSGYVLTFAYLMLPMDNLVNNLPNISRASIALRKIESLGLSLASHAETSAMPSAFDSSWECLELKNVTYPYQKEQDDSFILGPINLTFKPGELVFIVGGNGSGKSTLAKLITGLYSPETGEIRLNNKLINHQNLDWYRQHFSVIFSDFYLFDKLLGIETVNLDTQAQTYLKQLQLDHKVKIENGKFSTINLSQGQRKRLALLTAYLEDRPIYLFDEWAADQDPIFKEIFYTQFLKTMKEQGKAILIISHDDHYFYLADRIVKLDYGKIEYDKHL